MIAQQKHTAYLDQKDNPASSYINSHAAILRYCMSKDGLSCWDGGAKNIC